MEDVEEVIQKNRFTVVQMDKAEVDEFNDFKWKRRENERNLDERQERASKLILGAGVFTLVSGIAGIILGVIIRVQ